MTLNAIKDEKIVSEKTQKLKVTIFKPDDRTSKPKPNQNNSTFVEFAFDDSSKRNAAILPKKGVLVPSVSSISSFGNFKI